MAWIIGFINGLTGKLITQPDETHRGGNRNYNLGQEQNIEAEANAENTSGRAT